MLFYRILADTLGIYPVTYSGTAAEAHACAKAIANRPDVRVELVDIDTDKAGVLLLLNGDKGHNGVIKQTWKLSPRGAMVECPNGE